MEGPLFLHCQLNKRYTHLFHRYKSAFHPYMHYNLYLYKNSWVSLYRIILFKHDIWSKLCPPFKKCCITNSHLIYRYFPLLMRSNRHFIYPITGCSLTRSNLCRKSILLIFPSWSTLHLQKITEHIRNSGWVDIIILLMASHKPYTYLLLHFHTWTRNLLGINLIKVYWVYLIFVNIYIYNTSK